jgi:uncharacterized coiled-coil protein SlyX
VLTASALSIIEPAEKLAAKLEKQLEAAEHRIAEMGLSLGAAQQEIRSLTQRIEALTDRLKIAQQLLTEHGVPFPPLEG